MTAVLDARVVIDQGDFRLDVAVSARAGEVVALLGPNGAGKTTTLRALAGLIALGDGHVDIGGRRCDDPVASLFVPAERRPIGVVFQDYLLFPHLSALDNVAFGRRRHGVDRGRASEEAARWRSRARPHR